jgi:hypothetical protein
LWCAWGDVIKDRVKIGKRGSRVTRFSRTVFRPHRADLRVRGEVSTRGGGLRYRNGRAFDIGQSNLRLLVTGKPQDQTRDAILSISGKTTGGFYGAFE